MDFLKNLKISDDKHESGPTQPIPVAAPQPAKDESIFHKLGDALSGKQTPPPPPAPVAAPPRKEEHLFSKLGDAFSGKKTPPPAPVAVPTPQKEESVFHKLGDALTGRKTPPPPPPAPAEPEGLFDKIGSALGHKPTPPPERPDLLTQFSNTITGKKEEPPKPQTLGDKLNHALGGGASGEAKEGKLDKAIDMFQEHVLKEGPQHNESALEQLKDKQIADTLRKTLGIEKKDQN